MSLRNAAPSSVARTEGAREGMNGWKLAALLRSLGLAGIMKAPEAVKRSNRLRSVCNTVTSYHVKIHVVG